jgi:hypothetical protein
VEPQAGHYLVGGGASPLQVTVAGPQGSRLATEKTLLMAPGKPGSITAGSEEQRGYHLVLQTPPATAVVIRASMTLGRR